MLTRLLISNLTVIRRADLEFGPGLTVITGETGAGKTMLTHAVRLIGGAKASSALIGPNGSEAYVEAEFSDRPPAAVADVADPDEPLTLARRLRSGGPTRSLCSGRACTADQLQAASGELISLTGQHAARELTRPGVQLGLLDTAGRHDRLLEQVADAWRQWQRADKELADLRRQLSERSSRESLVRHEVQLIEDVAPEPGEQEQLEQEISRLAHADSLLRSTAGAATALLDAEDGAIVDQLAQVLDALSQAAEHDQRAQPLADTVQAAYEELSYAARSARRLAESYEADPARLEDAQRRLAQIRDLRRRFHGMEIPDLLARCEELRRELSAYDSGEERLAGAEQAAAAARAAYERHAARLTQARKAAAQQLCEHVNEHLGDLALPGATFHVRVQESQPTVTGTDRVTFLLAANRGLPPAPLGDGASGGEMSRVNLALLLAVAPRSGTFIFDEVDAGIGGEVAHQVAAKLVALAEHAQVIVITHLAQIAYHAAAHYVVEKRERENVTETRIRQVTTGEQRNRELARLLGVNSESDQDAQTAAELVQSAARRHVRA